MCCSNGCGRTCVNPDRVPYYAIPLECPTTQLSGLTGTCNTTQPTCSDNSVCGSNQLCCQTDHCGRFCVEAINSTQPCLALRQLLTSGLTAGGIPGAYVPLCQDDGTFNTTQFHGSTGLSWCVDVRTGYPVSPFYPRGSTAQCSSESAMP